MTRTRLQWVAFTALGLVAGVGLWIIACLILMLFGLSFYAIHLASYAALALWATTAPLIYLKTKNTNPERAQHRITPLLVGTGITVTLLAIIWATTNP